MARMNLPNKLTMLRIFMIPVFVLLFSLLPAENPSAAICFILASLTDTLDGKIARKRNLITAFGKFMDPLADKILTQAAFILLVGRGDIPAWIVIVIVARELLITGFRTLAASSGVTIAASKWGKYKTAVQMLTLVLFLLRPFGLEKLMIPASEPVTPILLYLSLILTVISGWDYIVKNKDVLDLQNI